METYTPEMIRVERSVLVGLELTCPKCKETKENKENIWYIRDLVITTYPTHEEQHEELECNLCFNKLEIRNNPKKAMQRILREEKSRNKIAKAIHSL